MADQIVSSGTNYAVNVVVLRTLGVETFGAFSLGFFLYLFAISVTRAYPMEPLAIRYPLRSEADWRRAGRSALGSAVVAGIGFSGVALIAGALIGGVLGQVLTGLAIAFPGLVLQDSIRMMFFSRGRAEKALVNDLVWAAALLPTLGLAVVTGSDIGVITMAWGVAGSVAALAGMWQLRIVPRPMSTRAWWIEHRDIGPRFLAEAGLRTALVQMTFVGVGFVAGIAAVGYIRGAQLLMAPIQVVFLGLTPVLVPEGVRTLKTGIRSLGRLARLVSIAEVGMAIAWSAVVLVGFALVGPVLLGADWASFREFVPAIIAVQLATVATAGPQMAVRALGDSRRSLRATLIGSGAAVVLPIILATGGALSATWGLALATGIGALAWWLTIAQASQAWRTRHASDDGAPL